MVDMSCSFTADTDGYVYDLPGGRDVPPPTELDLVRGPGPWVAGFLGPTPAAADGTRESTHRLWFRVPRQLADDEHLHTALLGFATDWTGIGGRPLHLEGDTTGMVSLDHGVVPSPRTRRRVVVLRRALARQRRRTSDSCAV